MSKMVGYKAVESKLNVVPVVSTKMSDAIDLWSKMYIGESPWLHTATIDNPVNIVSLGLPATIASEKARTATIEMKSEITAPAKKDDNADTETPTPENKVVTEEQPKTEEQPTTRAAYLNEQYQTKLLPKIKTQLEYGIAKGGLVIKPYLVFPSEDTTDKQPEFAFDFIQADSFYPVAFDSSGNITECVFIQRKQDKNVVFTRLEHHILNGDSTTVRNYAFKAVNTTVVDGSIDIEDLGKEIPLTDVAEWKDLQAEVTIKGVDKLLFGYFKMPEANTIDPKSPLGVSGFSRAVSNIEQADKQYSRLLWEYEAGEMAIDIDRDALTVREDSQGNSYYTPTILQERLYRKIDLGEANTYIAYAPQLRDSSYVHGLNTILMRIEDQCALSRGTLSDPTTEARTATELRILKQRTFVANQQIQEALEICLRSTVSAMDVYCTLYDIVKDKKSAVNENGETTIDVGKYEISFEWDDSILVDVDEELNKRLALLDRGLTDEVELRMWYFGETETQAKDFLRRRDIEHNEEVEREVDDADKDESAIKTGSEMARNQIKEQVDKMIKRGE